MTLDERDDRLRTIAYHLGQGASPPECALAEMIQPSMLDPTHRPG
jgi:hypothetical protein